LPPAFKKIRAFLFPFFRGSRLHSIPFLFPFNAYVTNPLVLPLFFDFVGGNTTPFKNFFFLAKVFLWGVPGPAMTLCKNGLSVEQTFFPVKSWAPVFSLLGCPAATLFFFFQPQGFFAVLGDVSLPGGFLFSFPKGVIG